MTELLPYIEVHEIPELFTDSRNFWVDRQILGRYHKDVPFVRVDSEAVVKLSEIMECNEAELPHYLSGMPLTIPDWQARFKIADDAYLTADFNWSHPESVTPSIILKCELQNDNHRKNTQRI